MVTDTNKKQQLENSKETYKVFIGNTDFRMQVQVALRSLPKESGI
jgi:hypothetical protein